MGPRSHAIVLAGALALIASSAATAADTSDELAIANRSERELTGSLTHDGREVAFHGRLEGPSRATVSVEVGGLRLDTFVDFENQVARSDGHGAVMTLRDRQALSALYERLKRGLDGAPAGMAPHEALLLRRVAYWSEAPVGITLDTREFGPPAQRFDPRRHSPKAGVSALACQTSDDNGIAYFNCNSASQVECHDASHCFACALRPAGRNASECPGECGPGCNGLNIYTWDCLDHDYCCRIHGGCLNPWDSECGDEFREADDDFLWGWPNC